MKQNNMTYQTYIDITKPNPCNGFYVFPCGSKELDDYLSKMQQKANEKCETYEICLPLCCHGSIMYVMFPFEPKPIKCAQANDYLNVLSNYSLNIK